MKLVSLNCNGIRSAFTKGLDGFLKKENFDIVCFQEIKAEENQMDLDFFQKMGYIPFIHSASKKGYSGTAIFTKLKPKKTMMGSEIEWISSEGRIIRLDFEDFSLLNIYFPSGTSGDERQKLKMEFLDYIQKSMNTLKKKQKKLILCGDVNIAHTEEDIHDPKGNAKNSGFLPEERKWVSDFLASGWVDTFRLLQPEQKDTYSWWTYRFGARKRNKGWRIDYFFVTEALKSQIQSSGIYTDLVVSDHAPVFIEMK